MKKQKKKPLFLTIRLPVITKTGGAHEPAKGGKYHRGQEKDKTRKEIKAEFE